MQGTTYNRGKLLGGSSNLNFMIWMRGNPLDFDRWAWMSNDDQWTYANLLPFFKKTEDYKGPFPNGKKSSPSFLLVCSRAEQGRSKFPFFISEETLLNFDCGKNSSFPILLHGNSIQKRSHFIGV